jgi:uncharacterized membrane protein
MNDDRTQNAARAKDEVRWRVNNRIIGFSDGVFAIAITLLVLTIDVPANLTSQEVSSFLRGALPQVLIYGASFMVIGTFWLRHYRMFSLCRAVDTRMLVLNLVFLAFVSLLPFPSDLINFADQSPSAIIAFCVVGDAATLCEFALWRHLHRHPDLLLPDISEEIVVALRTLRFLSLGLFISIYPSIPALSKDRGIVVASISSALRVCFLSTALSRSLSTSRSIAELGEGVPSSRLSFLGAPSFREDLLSAVHQ